MGQTVILFYFEMTMPWKFRIRMDLRALLQGPEVFAAKVASLLHPVSVQPVGGPCKNG